MYSQSEAFKTAVINSHRMSIRLEVYTGVNGARILDTGNLADGHGGILDGEISIQSEAIRRRFTFQFTDPTGTYTPATANDVFTTYGREAKLYRGVRLADGTFEEKPLGVFGIANVATDDPGPGLTISVDGYDRADRVSRAKLTQDYVIAAGTNFATAIFELLVNRVPGLPTNFVSTSYTTPALFFQAGEDPWVICSQLAAAIGCELFFDPDGICILRNVPDFSFMQPVWVYREGDASTLLNLNKRYSNRETFNYFIVTGEHSSNTEPVRGEAYDDNPASPTYYKGPYGIVAAPPVSSKLVTTADQAYQAARALLQKSIGRAERLHFNAIVNPAHEVGDVIDVARARSKVDNRYVIDALAIPLTHNRAMDITTKVRQAA